MKNLNRSKICLIGFFGCSKKQAAIQNQKVINRFEKKIKAERQIVEQKEKEAQEIRELHQRKIKAEQDKKFWDMMNDPEGKGFEISMRSIFDKIILEV